MPIASRRTRGLRNRRCRRGRRPFRGTGVFHVGICGFSDLAFAETLSAFVSSEPSVALAFLTVPFGTDDATAIQLRLANAAVDDNLVLVKDWIKVYDSIGQVFVYTTPTGKAMGIIGALNPEVSPINQPYNSTGESAGGVVATEQSVIGPRSDAELGALCANGFIAITNQIPLANGTFGIFDDVCSSGDPRANNGSGNYIPVVRMTAFLVNAFRQIGAPWIGKNQSVQPNDPTRAGISASYNNFLAGLKPNGGTQRIDDYSVTCDLTNNTPQTIAQ